MSIEQWYRDAEASCGIQPGAKVRVLQAVPSWHNGWNNTWDPEMDAYVGQVVEVVPRMAGANGSGYGILLKHPENSRTVSYSFPFYVLEVVEEDAPPMPPPILSTVHVDFFWWLNEYPVEYMSRATIDAVREEMLAGTTVAPPRGVSRT